MTHPQDDAKVQSKTKRPLILVSTRLEKRYHPTLQDGLPFLEGCSRDFMDAILMAGGNPIVMPMTEDDDVIANYIELSSGLAIPGGQDVNPRLWGDASEYDASLLCNQRDVLELKLLKAFMEADKPIFATCRGYQLLNVFLGGTLNMHAETRSPKFGTTLWFHANELARPVHPVEVKPGSLLSRSMGGASLVQTNSAHHCCIDRVAPRAELVAEATDGMPEAIEVPSARFCLGVQWHPESTWQTIETDRRLWHAFVAACADM